MSSGRAKRPGTPTRRWFRLSCPPLWKAARCPSTGTANRTRDFTFVGTVAAVIEDAVLRKLSDPAPVNLAFGTRTNLLSLIGLLEDVLGTELEVAHLEPRAADVRDSQADATKLLTLFPEVMAVDLRDGLRQTVEWFRSATEPH